MPTHTNICNLWWFLHLSNLIDFIRHLGCFLSSDLVTVPGTSQKWHQYLNTTFLSIFRPIDYLTPLGSSNVNSRCKLNKRRSCHEQQLLCICIIIVILYFQLGFLVAGGNKYHVCREQQSVCHPNLIFAQPNLIFAQPPLSFLHWNIEH